MGKHDQDMEFPDQQEYRLTVLRQLIREHVLHLYAIKRVLRVMEMYNAGNSADVVEGDDRYNQDRCHELLDYINKWFQLYAHSGADKLQHDLPAIARNGVGNGGFNDMMYALHAQDERFLLLITELKTHNLIGNGHSKNQAG